MRFLAFFLPKALYLYYFLCLKGTTTYSKLPIIQMYWSYYKYSKALSCTFFGTKKNMCGSKFVQLELFNKAKARTSKNRAAKSFHYINSCISNFFGPYSKTCFVKVRAAWGRVSWGLTVYSDKDDALLNISVSLNKVTWPQSQRALKEAWVLSNRML